MADGLVLSISANLAETPSGILADAGTPRHTRRIADKILAAFNQAYAMGDVELARKLWDCLVEAETVGQHKQRRRPNQALNLAAQWVAFVDAREQFRQTSRAPEPNAVETSRAFRAMIVAHERWRAHNGCEQPSPLRPTAVSKGTSSAHSLVKQGGAQGATGLGQS